MNTAELIAYVQARTEAGHKLHTIRLSQYIKKGWLVAERQGRGWGDYYENSYTVEAADDFIRHLTSYTLIEAAQAMTKRLGWTVTFIRVKGLCKQNKVIHIGKPYRIPLDALHILQEQLIISLGIRTDIGQAMLATCRKTHTRPQLAGLCGVSINTIDRIRDGSRSMNPEVYDILLQLSQEGNTE